MQISEQAAGLAAELVEVVEPQPDLFAADLARMQETSAKIEKVYKGSHVTQKRSWRERDFAFYTDTYRECVIKLMREGKTLDAVQAMQKIFPFMTPTYNAIAVQGTIDGGEGGRVTFGWASPAADPPQAVE